ncbi:ABC transporter substrate-binding protein [Streptomyces bobili]|uniref:ABC transporter substrate-binding protein n=1 Tax=Streptomyces bobili TaxID=67280 RepID=UPI00379A83A7
MAGAGGGGGSGAGGSGGGGGGAGAGTGGPLVRWLREVWEIRLYRYIALLVTLALVAGAFFAVRTVTREDRSCAPGVSRPEGSGECVGVATDAYDFGQPRLREAVRAIDRENDALKAGSYVTVALMLPYTATTPSTLSDILHEVQGAYLAQWQANHTSNGQAPAIRLVLANPGATSEHWEVMVDQLERMTKSADRLRAVAGVGQSTDNNKKAVTELTRRGIPVIGASITADDLANGQDGKDPFPGLARVAPTNTDEARALASFAKVSAGRALLVYDKPGDPYTRTLQASFAALIKGSPYEPQPFTPPADRTREGTTANTFRQITHLVCDTAPGTDTILFAGRHTQLRQFINALGTRGCQDRRFTLLTGDEGSYLTGDKKLDRTALTHNLSVRYTALAHPDAWPSDPAVTGGSARDARTLTDLLARAGRAPVGPIGETGGTGLEDGQLIIGYDAVRLAVHGVREATPDGAAVPPLAEVGLQWPQVKGSLRVNGASGWICLDVHGNPYDKAVPIVELTPEGGSRFVRIAWPEGKPPAKECLPPS